MEGECNPASDEDCRRASRCHDGEDCEITRSSQLGAYCTFEPSYDEEGEDW